MNIYMYLLILSKGNAGRIGQKRIKIATNKEWGGRVRWRGQNKSKPSLKSSLKTSLHIFSF